METTLIMDFVWITWNFKALYGKYLVSKSRVLIELHPNLRFLEIKVGKNSKSTRKVGNPPFEVGFMVKWQAIELGFRINPNKPLGLACVWVKTHIRMVLE